MPERIAAFRALHDRIDDVDALVAEMKAWAKGSGSNVPQSLHNAWPILTDNNDWLKSYGRSADKLADDLERVVDGLDNLATVQEAERAGLAKVLEQAKDLHILQVEFFDLAGLVGRVKKSSLLRTALESESDRETSDA